MVVPRASQTMSLLAIVVMAQLATPARSVPHVLAFPEPGVDDTAAYGAYRTRLYRDAADNTVQIYVDGRDARVVHLWANADNESIGFSARTASGTPVALRWRTDSASVAAAGSQRTLTHHLVADAPLVAVGHFLLGSMRIERDFQHFGHHRAPLADAPYVLPELERLLASLERLPAAERRRHLSLLAATDVSTLRARLTPRITTGTSAGTAIARVTQASLDGRDTLVVEFLTDPTRVTITAVGDSVLLRARDGRQVPFSVRIASTAAPLTPLARTEIFSADFLAFLADAQRRAAAPGAADSVRTQARWLERQVRGVELLSSREKLMAGLPNYGTYFGRDMLVSALMMRTIWRPEMSELVIASVLRKLAPSGEVSHEEALGGQAVREAAAEYVALTEAALAARPRGDRREADSLMARARDVLASHRRVRENYHMIDDELQLPVLVARWIEDPALSAAHKRAFLLDARDDGEPRLDRLLRELGAVARMTAPYARDPVASNLVSFPRRDDGWGSTSWRDSGAGYAGGRFAMDVNAIWAPHALESVGRILAALPSLGFRLDSLTRVVPSLAAGTPLGAWARDTSALRHAIDTWRGAARHFVVRLGSAEVRSRVAARVAAMPAEERAHWTGVLERSTADDDSLVFLDVALDAEGRPIGVANTDPSTQLFLGEPRGTDPAAAAARTLRDVRLFVRDYPAGLFIPRVGPVVANDAYASPAVWQTFLRDHYHGPRVVWGREVNLFLLGVATLVAEPDPAIAPHAAELRAALRTIADAVAASGFRSELWSYEMRDGRIVPVRYGTGSDVQLWSTTDLAVQFALSRLGR